jgi:hypothetical protein
MAEEASREADEVATRLQTEVGRISSIHVRGWDASMKRHRVRLKVKRE